MKKNPSQPSTEQIHIRTPRLAARFSPIVTLRKSDHWQSAQRPSNQARGYVFRRRPSRWTRSTLSAMQCRRPFKRPPMSGRISQQQARRSKIPPESLPAEPGFPTILISASRSEEHTSELQSLMRNSYAVFCLKQKILKAYDLYYFNTQTIK